MKLVVGAEVLKVVEGFIHEDPTWLLFTQDLTMDNLVVEAGGQVFLRDLSQVGTVWYHDSRPRDNHLIMFFSAR